MVRKSISLVLLALCPALALAENLGTLSISDILLRPSFTFAPGADVQPGFSIGESSLAAKWDLDHTFSAQVRIGSESLINVPARYGSAVNPNDIALVEAYAEYNNPYGRFRLGRLPIDFGLEGAESESELIFPRAMLFQQGLMGLRDNGFSYEVEYNHFFTEVVIHNGDGGEALENQYWYTGRWGYNFDKAQLGFSGQTGTTGPQSTEGSNLVLAAFNPNDSAKWRLGGLFGSWRPKQMVLEGEAYYGELDQSGGTHRYITGHLDYGYEWTDQISTFLRYDALDPNTAVSDDSTQQAALALVYANKSRNSRLILMLAHDFNDGRAGDDEYRLIWSLSPSQLPSSF